MIRSYTAATAEIDDSQGAVAEILKQLALPDAIGPQNTIGIISCYAEFVESGVYAALCQALPFDVVGTTTIAAGTKGEAGELLLTLMVITGDDLAVATAVSGIAGEEDAGLLAEMYASAREELTEEPKLILSFAPLSPTFSNDFYVKTMDELSGGVANFGTVTVDHNPDYHDAQVLINGEAYRDRFAIVLLAGEIEPTFYIGTISDDKIFPEQGVVTEVVGPLLKSINNVVTADHLQSLGLEKDADGAIVGVNAFPLIVDLGDGTESIVRVMFATTPEGYAVCGGNIPVGATLSIGEFNKDEILATTRRTLKTAAAGGHHNLLLYSCVGRYFTLGYETMGELDLTADILGDTSHMTAYSGGEICPVYDRDGQTHNRNHNSTVVVLAF